ncbi:hypothetical protein LXL04_025093 [Taraxacum kok-saghyz]
MNFLGTDFRSFFTILDSPIASPRADDFEEISDNFPVKVSIESISPIFNRSNSVLRETEVVPTSLILTGGITPLSLPAPSTSDIFFTGVLLDHQNRKEIIDCKNYQINNKKLEASNLPYSALQNSRYSDISKTLSRMSDHRHPALAGNDGTWHEVNRKKQRHVRPQQPRQVTSFFISKLPEGCNSSLMWKIFKTFGNMVDDFVSSRKDKKGNNFAFIRFTNVSDPMIMAKTLGTVKIDGAKIGANVAKFDKNQKPTSAAPRTSVFDRLSFPDKTMNIQGTSRWPKSNASFKEILTGGAGPQTVKKSLRIPDTPSPLLDRWKDKSLIGEARNLSLLRNLKAGLRAEGLHGISVKHMGGLSVMLSFQKETEAQVFLENGRGSWSPWFSSLKIWDGGCLEYQRIAWLNIFGIPLQLWDGPCMESVGGLFGKVITPPSNSDNSWDLSMGRIGIIVNSPCRIEESVEILWKEKQFKLFVTEEMGPPFSPLLEEDKEEYGISDTNSFLHRDDDEEEASSHHSFGDPQFSGTHDPTAEAHPNPTPDPNPISLSSDPNPATDPNPISLNSDLNPPFTNPQSEPQPFIDITSYQIPDLNNSFPTS